MSEGLNRVMLLGHLGLDPELKYGASGAPVLRLRLATNERYKPKDSAEWTEKTEWHTVVFFAARAEGLGKTLRKGERVYVEGRLQTREWEDKDGNKRYTTEVVGTQLLFLGSKGGGERQTQHREPASGGGGGYGGSGSGGTSDEWADDDGSEGIPF